MNMKTIFFAGAQGRKGKQVMMQAACSGGTGTFIEKTARKLLLGRPNMFLTGLQQACVHHLGKLWKERGIALPEGKMPADLIRVPDNALYFGALGCIEAGRREHSRAGIYQGKDTLGSWLEKGRHEKKAEEGSRDLGAGRSRARSTSPTCGSRPTQAGRQRKDPHRDHRALH